MTFSRSKQIVCALRQAIDKSKLHDPHSGESKVWEEWDGHFNRVGRSLANMLQFLNENGLKEQVKKRKRRKTNDHGSTLTSRQP